MKHPTNQTFLLFRKLGETNCPNVPPKDVVLWIISWTLSWDLLKVMFVSGEFGKDVGPRIPTWAPGKWEIPNYKPYSSWVFMGSNPQESLENTIDTMGTLLGVHPIVP